MPSGNSLKPCSASAALMLPIQTRCVTLNALNGPFVTMRNMAQKTMAMYLDLHLILSMSKMAIMM